MSSSPPGKLAGSVNTGRRARILIADDHTLVAEAFKGLLEPEFEVVGIVPNGRILMESFTAYRPDVLLLDISMPELNGLDAGEQIRAEMRHIKLVYVTMASRPEIAAEAFRRGASAYVLKHGDAEEVRIAVRRAIRGEVYVSSLLDKDEVGMHWRLGRRYGGSKELSARQREILQLIAEGKSMKEIAHILDIKAGTVAFHKYEMMQKLGIKRTAGLIDYAFREGVASMRCGPAIENP
jgi:DNA-binding NarL/FixJ family response regulator